MATDLEKWKNLSPRNRTGSKSLPPLSGESGVITGYFNSVKYSSHYTAWVKKTWKDYCPNCKKNDVLVAHGYGWKSPHGYVKWPDFVEITCKGCDSDYDGYSGKELGNKGTKLTEGTENSSGSSSNSSTTPTSIRDSLKEVLSGWDGEVECFMREGIVYIRKIKSPLTATLSLIESEDIIYDSISVTDYNPNTVNKLIVNWKKKSLILTDDYLIKRFGTVSKITTASSKLTKDELYSFAEREFAKLKRENGHILECKVLGDSKWKVGQWVRVYIPTFNIDGYMYLTKVSQEDSGSGWLCNLTLEDYPPSLGKPKKPETSS